jgi:hypothetical protein
MHGLNEKNELQPLCSFLDLLFDGAMHDFLAANDQLINYE